MRFTAGDDERQLRDSAERFVSECYGFDAWRATAREHGGFRRETWDAMARLGWMAVALPEECGGLGLGVRERAAIMESLGAGLVLEPYWSTAVLCAELLRGAGTDPQQRAWIPRIADGSLRGAFACLEASTGYDWHAVDCAARRVPGGWRIDGAKIAVLDAPLADRLMVLARTAGEPGDPRGLSLFWVPADAPGISRRDHPSVDERRCSDLTFTGLEVPGDALVGEAGAAAEAVARAIDHGLAALCAEAVGVMTRALHATVEYLKVRRQFGRPLAEFQVLRHRVADMVMAVEQSRSISLLCTMSLDDVPEHRARVAAAAKAQVGIAGRFVGESAVQLHGGIGVTDELQVGHHLKRLLAIDALLGDANHQLGRVAGLTIHPTGVATWA